ncbi:hypothetical protein BLA29_010983, partial [Euroglyphus maynei]
CLSEGPEDFDDQKKKDDLYKQKIEALVALERSKNQLESISIDDDDLSQDFNILNDPSANLSNQPNLFRTSNVQSTLLPTQVAAHGSSNLNLLTSNNHLFPSVVRASDLLTFDGNVMNWQPFRISFEEEVMLNPNLMESKKRNLLLKIMSGEAQNRAMDLVRQGKTLQALWSALNSYYGDPKKVDEYLIKQIRAIPFVNSVYDTAKLEKMLQEVRRISS